MVYRGNVMEVRENSLVVMLEDCTFQNVKKFKGIDEGMEIYFEDRDIMRKSNVNLKNISIVAAVIFLFVVTSFYGINIWDTNYRAVALVSVDINPSVELKINRSHNVIKAIAINEDAKNLPLNNLKNQPLDEALEKLVDMARIEGYIKEKDENYILVTSVDLTEKTEEENILTNLISKGKAKIETSAIEAGEQVEVISIQSNKETLEEAKKESISVGKKELYQNKGVKEIKEMKQNIKEEKQLDEHLKNMEKKKKEFSEKIKELQKNNNKNKDTINSNNNNNDKYKNILKEMKEEEDRLKETIKLNKDKAKEEIKQQKDDFKEEIKKQDKEFEDQLKQNNEMLKEENKNNKADEKEENKNNKANEKEETQQNKNAEKKPNDKKSKDKNKSIK